MDSAAERGLSPLKKSQNPEKPINSSKAPGMPVKRVGGREGGGAEAGGEIRVCFWVLNKSLVESEGRKEGEDSRSHTTTAQFLSFLSVGFVPFSLLLNNWWELWWWH